MVVVKVDGGKEEGQERKLSLSSLRAPRGGKKGEGGEPWAAEVRSPPHPPTHPRNQPALCLLLLTYIQ